jgi:hypothetical protein
MMRKPHKPIETMVAQGWVLMFLLLVCIFLTEFLTASVGGNLAMYSSAEGIRGLHMMVILILLHAFIPMLVLTFEVHWFRWVIMILTLGFALIMMAHEILHLFVIKNRQFGTFDLLDFAHHGLALWVARLALRWARE